MNIFDFTLVDMQKMVIVFVRISAILLIIPFYGQRIVPVQVKLGLALLLTIMVLPLVNGQDIPPGINSLPDLSFVVFQNILAGLLIGFIPVLLFAGVQLGGELIGFQMGFTISGVFDPLSQNRISLFAQFQYLIAILVFISINGHLYLLEGIVNSFQIIPLVGVSFQNIVAESLMKLSGEMFVIGLKIAAPVIVAILLINVGLGFLSRTLPQMNMFLVGFPIQIGVGLITLGITIPVFVYVFEKMFYGFIKEWQVLISVL